MIDDQTTCEVKVTSTMDHSNWFADCSVHGTLIEWTRNEAHVRKIAERHPKEALIARAEENRHG